MKRITIDPLTRLEGHGRVDIFLDDDGRVANAYLLVPEMRGFEQLCVGRPAEEMPRITNRICGLCPEAHHMASVKALDALYGVEPSPAVHKVRELVYTTFVFVDHATHFFVLAAPDFFIAPDAPTGERNLLGVIRTLGQEIGRQIIETRVRNHHVLHQLGGRGIHLVAGLPGGWSQPLTEETRVDIEQIARSNVDFALAALELFDQAVLGNQEHATMMMSPAFADRTYSMGTVDTANRLNFFEGEIRVVDPEGGELVRYPPDRYLDHVAERVEPWTYMKFPYLRAIGWHGFEDGCDSGVYTASPLARLNAADGMATPRAQEHFERFFETLDGSTNNGRYRPIHQRLATHWARLIELLHAAERMLELATDREITDPGVRVTVGEPCGEGIGSVEAPRGTLTHHYRTDENGVLTDVNLIVGTTNNHAAMAMSITKAARALIAPGRSADERVLNRIEMVIRSYDPCLSCATHTVSDTMPLEVRIRAPGGEVLHNLRQ
jgi:F420-non-reducing hydrogenase large subunit